MDVGRIPDILVEDLCQGQYSRAYVPLPTRLDRGAIGTCRCRRAADRDVTGYSLQGVEAILDAHYLDRDVKLAEIAVMKLETRTKL